MADSAVQQELERLREQFTARFGAEPRLFRAPGRVNLIGEHTDYNDGFVMPAAIEFSTWVAIGPRPDGELHIASLNLGEQHDFAADATRGRRGEPRLYPAKNWTDYVRGVALMLREAGHEIPGANIALWGNVPLGAGLSSSASLEVAAAVALLGISNLDLPRQQIARLCQRAENEFVGAKCGIMDQFVAVHGRADCALLLDCRSLNFELLPLPEEITIVIANTMVKHSIAGGEYNRRRQECEEGVRLMQSSLPNIGSLRDVTAEQLESCKAGLPEKIYRRCRHVVSENARVLQFAQALRASKLELVGELMAASHASLRDDYEVSCRELDIMVSLAEKAPGVVGARMTGGGFGGCIVNLVRNQAVAEFRERLASEYKQATGTRPEIYVTRAADGAAEVH